MYIIRDREGGNVIDEFETLKEAQETLNEFIAEDETEGTYTPDFYEIYDSEKEEIIETK